MLCIDQAMKLAAGGRTVPAIAHAKDWSMFGAAAVGYGRDQYRI